MALSCQVTRKQKRATNLEFTTISAIIFIHCYRLLFYDPLGLGGGFGGGVGLGGGVPFTCLGGGGGGGVGFFVIIS